MYSADGLGNIKVWNVYISNQHKKGRYMEIWSVSHQWKRQSSSITSRNNMRNGYIVSVYKSVFPIGVGLHLHNTHLPFQGC